MSHIKKRFCSSTELGRFDFKASRITICNQIKKTGCSSHLCKNFGTKFWDTKLECSKASTDWKPPSNGLEMPNVDDPRISDTSWLHFQKMVRNPCRGKCLEWKEWPCGCIDGSYT